ncbi:MAG: DUF6172 family protein [Sulfurovum sp.]
MKKIFKLTNEKLHQDRVMDSVKNEIRKYMKREKKKKLVDASLTYWDFDCKIGLDSDSVKVVEADVLIKELDSIKNKGADSCYIEILVKVVNKPLKIEELTTDIE